MLTKSLRLCKIEIVKGYTFNTKYKLIPLNAEEKNNMKKSILAVAGVAAFAGVAMPFGFASAAEGDIVITYNLTVNVDPSCSFERGAGEGTYSLTLGPNSDPTAFEGETNFTIKCNNAKGYKVTAAFNGLEGNQVSPAVKENIPYTTSALTKGTAGWSAFKDSSSTAVSAGEIHTGSATTTGDTFKMTYKAATAANQAAGVYTGTAVYTFAQNS